MFGCFALEIQLGGGSSDSGNPGGRGVKKLPICRGCVDFFWNSTIILIHDSPRDLKQRKKRETTSIKCKKTYKPLMGE